MDGTSLKNGENEERAFFFYLGVTSVLLVNF